MSDPPEEPGMAISDQSVMRLNARFACLSRSLTRPPATAIPRTADATHILVHQEHLSTAASSVSWGIHKA